MKHSWCKVLLLLILVILSTLVAFAGNGKITGVVKDAATGEPVVGANVVIEGTLMGAAADAKGVYVILAVPPGTYNVVVSAVGYARAVVQGVQVRSDQTVSLDISLRSEAIGLKEVVVEAERKLVDKTLTQTRTVVSSGELNNAMPVLSVQELLNTTASVFKGRIRGSQREETKTLLDGIDITDQFRNVDYAGSGDLSPAQTYNRVSKPYEANGTTVNMNSSSLSELNVIAGAANAEYAAASAGIYSANLREGRGTWTGRAFFRSGGGGFDRFMKGAGYFGPDFYPATDTAKYLTNKRTLAAAGNAKAARYIWTPDHKYDTGESPTIDAEISTGGSVVENFGVFFTGRLNDTHGFMPNEFSREANLSLKANYDFTKSMKLALTGVLQDRGQIFGWKNRQYNDASRYFLEGVPVNDGYSSVVSAKFTHFLTPETFYEIQVSNVGKSGRIGFLNSFTTKDSLPNVYDATNGSADFLVLGYDIPTVKKYIGPVGSGRFFNNNNDDTQGLDPTITTITGGGNVLANPTYYYENLQTSVTTLKADLTSQVTLNHQLRAGAQLRLHSVKQDRRSTVISPTDIDPAVGVLLEQYDKKPMELGGYVQDRIEFSGLIMNIGARIDGFDPDASEFTNFYTPYVYPPTGSFNVGPRAAFVPYRSTDKIKMKWFFSPRIGVSHPITENSTMYFSFSRSSQPLPFSQIYMGYNNVNNPSLPNQMRANQDPYKSTNYEFGASWEFLPRISLNANAYFREVENFARYAYTLQSLQGQNVTTYNVYFNSGYADARGVEVTLNIGQYSLQDIVRISGRINYAWSVIKAPAGGPAANKTGFARNTADSVYTQLPFDDAKNFKMYEINVGGGQSVLGAGFDRTHRLGYALSLQFPYEILLSVVGTYTSGFLFTNPTVDNRTARQLETAPSNSSVDIRLEKGFLFAGKRLGVFMDVKNLMNKQNILAYATATGASQLKFYNTGDPTGEYSRAILPEGTSVYDMPRQVYIGAYFEF